VARTIASTVAAHPECGVAIWKPIQVREIKGFSSIHDHMDENGEPKDAVAEGSIQSVCDQVVERIVHEQTRGIKTLILSEENMGGRMRSNLFAGDFYPTIAQRLSVYRDVLPVQPVRIALGIRNYGPVWNSAYHYSLQKEKKVPVPNLVRDALLASQRGWYTFVQDVKRVWPDKDIQIWDQETLEGRLAAVCAQITGLDESMFILPDKRINARTRHRAKKDLFSQEENTQLSERYHRDISMLKQDSNVTWIGGAE